MQYLGRDNAAILNSLPHLLAFYMFIEYRIVLLKLSHCENESCSRARMCAFHVSSRGQLECECAPRRRCYLLMFVGFALDEDKIQERNIQALLPKMILPHSLPTTHLSLRYTERQIKVCTWLREISSCSCLTVLSGSAWVLLSKTYKPLFAPLYNFSLVHLQITFTTLQHCFKESHDTEKSTVNAY